jgi:hypothetical protein
MQWNKRGHLFNVSGEHGWMNSHAQIPTALVMEDRVRIYFATRPERGLSLTTFVDVSRADPKEILYLHNKPLLELGSPGSFDEHGIMPSSVCEHNGQVRLYYGGWSRRTSVPYSNWTGLALSDDGGYTFRKAFPGPIVDRTPHEIYSATACFVLPLNDEWHMWYASGIDWIPVNGHLEECYVIKHGWSDDGIAWRRDNRQLLPSLRDHEPTHRPSILRIGETYHMWFCRRGIEDFRDGSNSYRIGYARSTDVNTWKRDDSRAGIDVSSDGWDSRMIAYPYVFEVGDQVWMLYNGNGFGASGFGYAVLDGV